MYHIYDFKDTQPVCIAQDVTISPPFNERGGTATICHTDFRTRRHPLINYVAKLYRTNRPYYQQHHHDIAEKLQFMVRNKHTYMKPNYAWPEFLVYDVSESSTTLVGFLMKYIPGGKTIREYIEIPPENPQTKWLLAYGVIHAIIELHRGAFFMGDLHPGNLLAVPRQNMPFDVYFIDCDSYVIHNMNRVLYSSPLQPTGCYMLYQNQNPTEDQVRDNEHHATAHILFELLFGHSPYFPFRNDIHPVEAQLHNRIFPCIHRQRTAHPTTQATFAQLPLSLQDLFTAAFSTYDMPPLADLRTAILEECHRQLR